MMEKRLYVAYIVYVAALADFTREGMDDVQQRDSQTGQL